MTNLTPSSTQLMFRAYTNAVIVALLGRQAMKPGLAITGGDPLDQVGRIQFANAAAASETDVVHVECKWIDGQLTLCGMTVVLPRENRCHVASGCRLWMPENSKRARLIPQANFRGHFQVRPDEILHIDGKPSRDVTPGFVRAEDWLQRHMNAQSPACGNTTFFYVPDRASRTRAC